MSQPPNLHTLTACQALEALRSGQLSALALTEACLARIEATEPNLQAWQFLDPDYARAQAKERDAHRQAGRPLGPLHGLPVGVKDIVDTANVPTENGTSLHRGRIPKADAGLVLKLKAAGAVMVGKTVTTELAVYTPGKTRNPRDPSRSPGGSSSGSAAAVAAEMVPLALATQTNGSTIRPAAYCGVYGFKPSLGLLPRGGVLRQSPPLDQPGVMARSLEDCALLAESLQGHDPRDPFSRLGPALPLLALCQEAPPVTPRLGFVKGPTWHLAEREVVEAFAELTAALGEDVLELPLPRAFDLGHALHQTVMEADLALNFDPEYQRGKDQLSDTLVTMIERGRQVTAMAYNAALERRTLLIDALAALFDQCDALLTPATTGVAPQGLAATGSPTFCTLWTLCGLPAVTLPLLEAPPGLPVGVQLVGPPGDDGRLLRTARWLVERLAALD